MTPPFEVVLRRAAVQAATTLTRRQRHQVESFLDLLANAPGQSGDFHELDALGRRHEVKALDDAIVTWWVDHAAREIRVVEIERIESGAS